MLNNSLQRSEYMGFWHCSGAQRPANSEGERRAHHLAGNVLEDNRQTEEFCFQSVSVFLISGATRALVLICFCES